MRKKKKLWHLFFFFFFFCPFALVTNLDIKEASKQLNDNNNNNNDRTRERLTSLDSTHGENEQKTVQTTPSFPLHTYIHVYTHIYMCVYVGRASSTCTRHTPCLVQSSRQSKKKKGKKNVYCNNNKRIGKNKNKPSQRGSRSGQTDCCIFVLKKKT